MSSSAAGYVLHILMLYMIVQGQMAFAQEKKAARGRGCILVQSERLTGLMATPAINP